MAFRLAYLYLILAHSKIHGQIYDNFDCDSKMVTNMATFTTAIDYDEAILWDLNYHAHFDKNITKMVTYVVSTTIAIEYEVTYSLSIGIFRSNLILF